MTGEILLQADNISKTLRRPEGRGRRVVRAARRHRHHAGRAERRRQDDAVQPDDRTPRAGSGRRSRCSASRILGLPHWRIARLGIGRTFQDLKLFSHMTVLENVLDGDGVAAPGSGRPADAPRRPRASARVERALDGDAAAAPPRHARGRSRLCGAQVPLDRAHHGVRRAAVAARRAGLRPRSQLLRSLPDACCATR